MFWRERKIAKRIRINPDRSPLSIIRSRKLENNQEEKVDKSIENLRNVIERSETISRNYVAETKRNQLMKMMYEDDIGHELVTTKLGISTDQLQLLVDDLVELGFVQYCADDEVELTKEGVFHIITQEQDIDY